MLFFDLYELLLYLVDFQVVKNNGYELDCSQFHSDYDVLRQFPFPVMFISPDDDEYEKTVAIMDKNNTFVHTLAIRGENLVPMSVFCLSNLDTLEIERTPFENGKFSLLKDNFLFGIFI
jgi:hypothetical protein